MTVIEKCEECGEAIQRHHICEDYVVWMCKNNHQELEHFSQMNDEGWDWVRKHYSENKK